MLPVLFIGHGSPMNAIEQNPVTDSWSRMVADIPAPRAIVVISAHWLTQGLFVASNASPETIHDFFGFPQELFDIQYPCPGEPAVAKEIQALLSDANCQLDPNYGVDHGAWAILRKMYPDANVPVLQLSIDYSKPMQWHYQLAQLLKPLREQNVLFIGSGNIVHNIAKWRTGSTDFSAEFKFDDIVVEHIAGRAVKGNDDLLVNYRELGDWVLEPVPEPDHYIPLLYCLGLAGFDESVSYNVESNEDAMGRMMRSARFG